MAEKKKEVKSLTGATSRKKLTLAQRRENKRIYREEFEAAGFPTLAIGGLLARIEAESGFDPTAVNLNDPNGGSGGGFQWNGVRLQGLGPFAAKHNTDPDDTRVQAKYIVGEVKGQIGTEGKHGKKLLNATNPEEAAKAVMGLARPQGWTSKNPEKGLGYEFTLQRIQDFIGAKNRIKKEEQPEDLLASVDNDLNHLNAALTGLGEQNGIPISAEEDETKPIDLLKKDKGKEPINILAAMLGGVSMAAEAGGKIAGGLARSQETADTMTSDQLSSTRESITGFLQSLPNVGKVGPTAIRR